MANSIERAAKVSRFLYEWEFENWYGLNPGHAPLTAKSRRGLIGTLRVCVPAVGGATDYVIENAVAGAGYELVKSGAKFLAIKRLAPLAAMSQQAQVPGRSAKAAGAQASRVLE